MTNQTQNSTTDSVANAGAAPVLAAATATAVTTTKEAKPAKEPKVAKASAPEPTVVVTGPEKGRWRAGRPFNREPVSIPLGELSDGDLDALKADPELMVQVIDAPH